MAVRLSAVHFLQHGDRPGGGGGGGGAPLPAASAAGPPARCWGLVRGEERREIGQRRGYAVAVRGDAEVDVLGYDAEDGTAGERCCGSGGGRGRGCGEGGSGSRRRHVDVGVWDWEAAVE